MKKTTTDRRCLCCDRITPHLTYGTRQVCTACGHDSETMASFAHRELGAYNIRGPRQDWGAVFGASK